MNNQSLVEFLKRNHACGESLQWLGDRDLVQTWADCERGDWLLWLAAKAGIDCKRLVMAACACARLSLMHVRVGEERPRIAIETAEAWCRGEATIEQVREARKNAAARAAAGTGPAGAAGDAAATAAYAATRAATYAAAYAATAADAAYAAADAAAANSREMQQKTADIVRSMITVEKVEGAIRAQGGER